MLNSEGKAVKGDEASLKGDHETLNDDGKALTGNWDNKVWWIGVWGWGVGTKDNIKLLKGDEEALNGDTDVQRVTEK